MLPVPLVHGSHVLHVLQVGLLVVRFEYRPGCGGRIRCMSLGGAARRRISSPEMLLPLLVPLLWLWSWTGAAPSGTEQLDSVVSFPPVTFLRKFVQNRRNDGKSPPSGGMTSNINYLLSRSKCALTSVTSQARFELDHLIGSVLMQFETFPLTLILVVVVQVLGYGRSQTAAGRLQEAPLYYSL